MVVENNKKPAVDGEVKQPIEVKAEVKAAPPVVDAIPATSAVPPAPQKTQEQLIMDLLIQQAAFNAEDIATKREHAKRVNRARAEASNENFKARQLRQAKCAHLKGGKIKRPGQSKDFSLYYHRFIDGSERVQCFICSANWMPGDTKKWIYRNNEWQPNPSSKSWDDALAMLAESTNKPSSSEIVFSQMGSIPTKTPPTPPPSAD